MSPPEAERGVFSRRAVAWIVIVGVVSFCAIAALSAYAPDLRQGGDGGPHALSRSAIGYAGLAELLRGEGRRVLVSRDPLFRGRAGVFVLTPGPGVARQELERFRYPGMRLIVLPKWLTMPDPVHPGWVRRTDMLALETVAAPARQLSASTTLQRAKGVVRPVLGPGSTAMFLRQTLTPGPVEGLQTISGPDWVPVLVDRQGRAVMAIFRTRPILVLADPDLFNTHGLADLQTARAATAILSGVGERTGPVVFDVSLNGFARGRSLLRLMLEPPFLGATLCLLAAAVLAGLQAAGRFGPPARADRALAFGKQALADNSAALVRLARREPRMAAPYAQLTRDAAARAIGAPRDLDPARLEALLDRMGPAAGEPFTALAAEAAQVRTKADLMRLARRLFDWRLEMTRGRR